MLIPSTATADDEDADDDEHDLRLTVPFPHPASRTPQPAVSSIHALHPFPYNGVATATMLTITTHSPDETLALGERIGRAARPGDVIALTGNLGAGKTVLAKGIMKGLGGNPDDVTSPTFVLMMRHDARLPLFHFDAYRLARCQEMLDIGAEEAYYGSGVTVVEWADRVAESLPGDRLEVEIELAGAALRSIRIRSTGKASESLLERATA